MFDAVKKILPDAVYYQVARIISLQKKKPVPPETRIAVITAGTSDMPVAEEAAVTAELLGNNVLRIYDAGVAGIHRLVDKLPEIRSCRVIVVIAGMEGALASVVGGLVSMPVIAVPTSVGYGANFGGISALLAMLTSCSAGVTVVNIDNGFGAGFSASMINKMA
jgi:NCAIR mutase (PurE)-related protein